MIFRNLAVANLCAIAFGLIFNSIAISQDEVRPISEVDIWNLPPLPVYPGAYEANWDSLSKYEVPEWFREAKLGIWSHWDPQSVPEQGDWYARRMYIEGERHYEHCLKTYGHPSEFGYKDLCGLWTCDQWDPDGFVNLAVETGGKYFTALANHHDNYDLWDSKYQPWNSVNLGPKKDVIGIWGEAARKRGLPFGVTVHATPARTWGQFMSVRYTSDKSGPKKGVPYDAVAATLQDGKGALWEGLDPRDLYGPPHVKEQDANSSPFANQFMWRVDDLLKYNPDLLYFDESVGLNQVDLGVKMGFGHLAPQIAANYYNKSMAMNQGKQIAVLNIKEVGGKRNSLGTQEEAETVSHSLVKDSEKKTETSIEAYPFQTDDSIGPWHMDVNRPYSHDARWVIHKLIENVSKNGNLLLGIPQRAQGNVDPEAVEICHNIGAWLKTNGEGIYGSRPFEVYKSENGPVFFTRKDGHVYASCLKWPQTQQLVMPELRLGSATVGVVSEIELLGSSDKILFEQTEQSLTVQLPPTQPNAIAAVFKIVHDKDWVNDDDPGVHYYGWTHRVNRDRGEFNNDVYDSRNRGDRCTFKFNGTGIKIVSNINSDSGDLVVLIDGQFDKTVDLARGNACDVQQIVYQSSDLSDGEHQIDVVNASDKLVVIDAFIVRREVE
ncbi:Alpha-L-fucosidase [Planctomycetes bacterium CA13]|uniref:alpha-L-fucosidase n=1 Tax=Novipirellula herctigrandis TaxID=2527986 RepID=A0A5C5ZBC9_9BACT|nr:Alpha-L-fucosidase [Planctomycetes bacterium CA13]